MSILKNFHEMFGLNALTLVGLAKDNGVAGVPGCKLRVIRCQNLVAIGIGVKMGRKKLLFGGVLAGVFAGP
jgi:hypothetical protein